MQFIEGIERLVYLYNEDGWNYPLVTFARAFRIFSLIEQYPDKILLSNDGWKQITFVWNDRVRDPLFLDISSNGINLHCKKQNGEMWSSSVEDNLVMQLDQWIRFANE